MLVIACGFGKSVTEAPVIDPEKTNPPATSFIDDYLPMNVA
jgi:hypothetical protein